MTLQTQRVRTLEQVRVFIEGSEAVDFVGGDREGVYVLVRRSLVQLEYHHRLSKPDKGLVKRYLEKVTGLSRSQLTRLIGQHLRTGKIKDRRGKVPARPFERRRPNPRGQPGFVRVDTVHQGDLDGVKGVYHINVVDEVTQYEYVGTVAAISEAFLLPVLSALIKSFPFKINGFHADNGSEYINHRVAELLNKLHIGEFTKSRARRTNDNALAESKNASVVRKWLGYAHIPQRFAGQVNAFNRDWLSPFLNYHRPCLFPTEECDDKGRVRKRYRDADTMTPYDKFKSLDDVEQYLLPGVTFEQLDNAALAVSDVQAAEALNQAREELFRSLKQADTAA